ncbi:MAG: hypothetical protein HOV80_39090 [Polyangiaceae bacterium]|nr:hypothetical protein [Polyangiaceae bacterium]
MKSRGGAACALAVVTCWSVAAHAEQFVVFDETWNHSADLPDSHYVADSTAETPADWTSPVDYRGGTIWVYLEVFTKPTDTPTRFQACFLGSPTYACTLQTPTYTEAGTYEWKTEWNETWSPPNEAVDWSQGIGSLSAILKDDMNGKPSADNVGEEIAALYMPSEVRMVVTVVSPGGIYVPPEPTGAGGEGGGSTTGSTVSTSSSSSTSGPATTAAASGSATTGAGGAGAGGASGDDGGDGCSVGSDEPESLWTGAFLLAAALFARSTRRNLRRK